MSWHLGWQARVTPTPPHLLQHTRRFNCPLVILSQIGRNPNMRSSTFRSEIHPNILSTNPTHVTSVVCAALRGSKNHWICVISRLRILNSPVFVDMPSLYLTFPFTLPSWRRMAYRSLLKPACIRLVTCIAQYWCHHTLHYCYCAKQSQSVLNIGIEWSVKSGL